MMRRMASRRGHAWREPAGTGSRDGAPSAARPGRTMRSPLPPSVRTGPLMQQTITRDREVERASKAVASEHFRCKARASSQGIRVSQPRRSFRAFTASHGASFHSNEKSAPSNPGIKHLAFKRMARPVRKRFVRGGLTGLRQRIRSQGIPRPRWSSAQPDPHKRHGVERHFLCQDLRVPD